MKGKRHSEEQIVKILQQAQTGLKPLERSCVLVGRKPIKAFKEAA